MTYKELKEYLETLSYEKFYNLIYDPGAKKFYSNYRKALPKLIKSYYPTKVKETQKDIEAFINERIKKEETKRDSLLTASGVDLPTTARAEIRVYTIAPFHAEEHIKMQDNILDSLETGELTPDFLRPGTFLPGNWKGASTLENLLPFAFVKPKPRTKKTRTGKHLVDNILKTNYPIKESPTLFDSLQEDSKKNILKAGVNTEMINQKGEGIKLSKGEYKVLIALANILQRKSQNKDSKEEDYYLGDQIGNPEININQTVKTTEGKKITVKAPAVKFTFYEIAKEFTGGKHPGGNTVSEVANILTELANNPEKKALIRYQKTIDLGAGNERRYTLEGFHSLLRIDTLKLEDINKEGKVVDSKKEHIVQLHPVFREQIEKLFIDMPELKEIIKAYGSPNVSEVAIKFILELSRAFSNGYHLPKDKEGTPYYTIGVEKLYQRVGEKYLRESRKHLIKKFLDKSIEVATGLGMIEKYELTTGKTGDLQYKFYLNPDY